MRQQIVQWNLVRVLGVLCVIGAFSTPVAAFAQGRVPGDIAQALVEAPLPDMRRWAGEELHYSVSMMGGEAARGAITVGRLTHDENLGEVLPIQGLIQSVGLLSAMVRFKYAGFSLMDASLSLPLWGEKLLEDSGRSRTYTTIYGSDDYEVTVTRAEGSDSWERTRLSPSRTDDAFSWIFRLREAPLNVGDYYTFYIFDGWLLRRLHARVVSHTERHEDVTRRSTTMTAEITLVADAMDENPALPWAEDDADLAPVFTSRRLDDVGTLWISLDERRVPVALEVRTPVGFMRIGMSRHVLPSP